ncbi:MAG: sulfurtransferase [Pseudomonadota bacterium]
MNNFSKLLGGAALTVALSSTAFAGSAEGPLVSSDWLASHLDDPSVHVFEVSVNPNVYSEGHIPGAVNLAWHTDLVDPVRRDIISKAALEKGLREAGVDEGDTIVIYGDTNNWFAAWGVWVFDIYGVEAKLLDGGRQLWAAEGRDLVTDVAEANVEAGDIELSAANEDLRARLVDVVRASETGAADIVDIRSSKEYSGELIAPPGLKETAVRAGHVTGAVNVSWGNAVAEDGRFKSPEELREIYATNGVDGSKPVITYCRIGERSSHTWFALSKILGYDAKNYDGSWTEYGNSVGVPITNVAGTVWTGK